MFRLRAVIHRSPRGGAQGEEKRGERELKGPGRGSGECVAYIMGSRAPHSAADLAYDL